MDTEDFIFSINFITQKVLSGEEKHLNPRDSLLTAAVTPELRALPHITLRASQVRAHGALGVGIRQA